MIDLQRLCSYGHFRIDRASADPARIAVGLGEAHSAFVTCCC
jgi:aspartate kinase